MKPSPSVAWHRRGALLVTAAIEDGTQRTVVAVTLIGWAAIFTGSDHHTALPEVCGTVPAFWKDPLKAWEMLDSALALSSPAAFVGSWLVMLAATMGPLLTDPVRHVLVRSLARRKATSVALFLLGYATAWVILGIPLAAVALAARISLGIQGPWTLLIGAMVATFWQITPAKQHCLNRCHRLRPLRAFGIGAIEDRFVFGLKHGGWCVGSCWALMLLPLLSDDFHTTIMVAAAVFVSAERIRSPRAETWRSFLPMSRVAVASRLAR